MPPTESSTDRTTAVRLESWKEIAAYLKRDVRTVQRWEKTEALPVHRHQHERLGSVYAFTSEIDEWQLSRSPESLAPAPEEADEEAVAAETAPVVVAQVVAPVRRSNWAVVIAMLVVTFAAVVGGFKAVQQWISGPRDIAITILPFANLSGDAQQEYFSNGITEDLITLIGRQSSDVRVTSLSSSMLMKDTQKSPREIGRELGVAYVVDGSVRREGGRVRVTAHLVRTSDEVHVWDERFDRDIGDVLTVQEEIASAIARAVNARVGSRESRGPVAPEVYETYLKGRFYWNQRTPEAIHRALQYFEQTTQLDPKYAQAYVGIADCNVLLGSAQLGVAPPREAMEKAKAAVEKALQLDATLPEAHATLGYIRLTYDWDWSGAEREFQKAIELNPGYATAHQWHALSLSVASRTDEALAELQIAERLDPLSPTVQTAISEADYFARRYSDALAAADAALKLDPNFVLAHLGRGRALQHLGRYDEAIAAYTRAWELAQHAPALTTWVISGYAAKGDRAEATRLLIELLQVSGTRYVSAVYISGAYASLGDSDKAMWYLRKAAEERCEYLIYLRRDPIADPLRNDPRFEELLREFKVQP